MTGDAPVDAAPPEDSLPPCGLPSLALRVATLAGCSDPGNIDGSRDFARFANPVNVVLGPGGVAYVTDFDSSKVRRVDPTGRVTTLVARSDLRRPFGLAMTPTGTIYVETDDDDMGMHSSTTGTIWRVNPATGDASVVARDIGRPRGLAVLPDGRLALADHVHHVVELLDPNTGIVTVLAGMMDSPGHMNGVGTAAQFAEPYDLALSNGDLIVTDMDNHVIRRVTLAGIVSDLTGTPGTAGHADGALSLAQFSKPKGIAVDGTGALYVTEAGMHDIRKIANATVSTAAGSGAPGWHDDDNTGSAQFYGVEGLDVTRDGTRIVIADGNVGDGMAFNHIRVIHQ